MPSSSPTPRARFEPEVGNYGSGRTIPFAFSARTTSAAVDRNSPVPSVSWARRDLPAFAAVCIAFYRVGTLQCARTAAAAKRDNSRPAVNFTQMLPVGNQRCKHCRFKSWPMSQPINYPFPEAHSRTYPYHRAGWATQRHRGKRRP